MELATGAMGSLLPKLDGLLAEEYNLQKGSRKGLVSLREEMASMEAVLVKVAEVPSDQLDEQVRLWAGEVRELSYVVEDSIDRLMRSIKVEKGGSFINQIRKSMNMTTVLMTKHRALHEFTKVEKMAEWHRRYMIGNALVKPVGTPHPLTRFLQKKKPVGTTSTVDDNDWLAISREPVGVQEASGEIIKRLMSDGGNNHQQLKVLSIFGFPGVGKTTLAKAVYDRMRTQFNCTAFVSVGRNPDLKKVFKDILLQIDKAKHSDLSAPATTADEMMCMREIRDLLQDKRYFIVVDDIWNTVSWETVRWAFVDSYSESIVITTTRIYEVAARAGGVYKLEPLSPDNSEKLLRTRLFDSEVKSTNEETTQLIQKILQKCGGVPLAIITIATLFSNKPTEDWYKVYDSINFGAEDKTAFKEARRIILFSYYDLPIHLRTCLVHLSIFPKNYMIRKDTLIWKWVAEGFIPENRGAGVFQMGEAYFNELINRNIIQPVEISHNGDIIGCHVHDMVVDIIRSIAKEKNFIALLNGAERQPSSYARRLALHGEVIEGQQHLADTYMSRVRSLNAISCDISIMPSLISFELLRVLAIEDCSSFQLEGNAYSLEHIGRLFNLRYLGLSRTPVSKLPEKVGKMKFSLEILDVRQTGIRELPKSVSLLSRLKCLRADGGSTRVPDWIGSLTSLEELSLSDVSSCPNFVKEVSKLTMLRELKIWIRVLDKRSKNALVKSLSNLQKIQVLHLNGGLLIEEAEWEGYVPPRQLHRLSLRIKSLRLPRWINSSLLPALSHLSVDLRVVEADDLAILGSFPGLISLELFIPNRVSLDIKGCDAFPKLRHCYASGMLRFLEGAAPRLESVHFNVMSALSGASFHCGFLGELPLLKEVRVEIFYSDAHVAVEVEKELWRAIHDHVNHPSLHVSQYKIVL